MQSHVAIISFAHARVVSKRTLLSLFWHILCCVTYRARPFFIFIRFLEGIRTGARVLLLISPERHLVASGKWTNIKKPPGVFIKV